MAAQSPVSISEIQGSGLISPFLNEQVSINNAVVTAAHENMLFVQSADLDTNPKTSDGILVIWSGAEDFSPSDAVNITGFVREQDENTLIQAQIINKIGASSTPLFTQKIDDDFPSTAYSPINDLESVEGQLVSFTDMRVTGPSIDSELTYISGSTTRPLREPGIEAPGINNLPVWDGNPEVFHLVPGGLNLSSNAFLHANMRLTGTGVVVQERFNYAIYPITYIVSKEIAPPSIMQPTPREFNVGCLNTLILQKEDSKYELRLSKIARYIRDQLGSPDVVALQEVGGTQEFIDLAQVLSDLTGLEYTAHSVDATGSINNGYMVQRTFTISNLEALGNSQSFDGGGLHDRAPLLLEGFINTGSGKKPLSILNLHLRSLNGISGNNSDFVRRKRQAQAISVAQMIRELQDENKQILVVGDYNAFQFSDGYVDVVNQIAGTPSLGALLDIQAQGLTPMTNISATFPPEEERYSFVFRGNAQILDHCVVSDFIDFEVSHFQFGRGNSDYPDAYLNQDIPYRASDHDGFSVYLDLDEEIVLGDPMIDNSDDIIVPNPFLSNSQIIFALEQKQNIQLELYSLSGQLIFEKSLGGIDQEKVSLPSLQNFTAGMYVLKISGRTTELTQKLVIIP